MNYEPLRIKSGNLQLLGKPKYRNFIHNTALAPSLKFFLKRHYKQQDFPFLDTKFNPNTGKDLPTSHYETLYTFCLGRSAEACHQHLEILDQIKGLEDNEKEEVRKMLKSILKNTTDALLEILEKNSGRCPFCVTREYKPIDLNGKLISLNDDIFSASDIFCAKGLLVSNDPNKHNRGKKHFLEFIEKIFSNKFVWRYGNDGLPKKQIRSLMLPLGAFSYLFNELSNSKEGREYVDLIFDIFQLAFERHYNIKDGFLTDYIDSEGIAKFHLNPGHAIELVGLGLQAIEATRESDIKLSEDQKSLFETTEEHLSNILLEAFKLGYNHLNHGMFELVDSRTGRVLNKEMPWWNLPETIRAAVRTLSVVEKQKDKELIREILRIVNNDYFIYYPNPDLYLFPFRTRNGLTGEVVDKMPTVPEADPLYHSNLSFIDTLSVLEKIDIH